MTNQSEKTASEKLKIGWFSFFCFEDNTVVLTEIINDHWQESKKLVAVGACAVVGMPAGQRNMFNEEQNKEAEFLIARFAALPKVLKVSEVVKVDAEVGGCPMEPAVFLKAVTAFVAELKRQMPPDADTADGM